MRFNDAKIEQQTPHLFIVRRSFEQLRCHVRGGACTGLTPAVAGQTKVAHLHTYTSVKRTGHCVCV